MVGNPVRINSRVDRQLIDQPVHVVGFIVYGLDIFVYLLRSIGNAVHNPLHIALDCRDGRFQIMGDVAYQLLILLFQPESSHPWIPSA